MQDEVLPLFVLCSSVNRLFEIVRLGDWKEMFDPCVQEVFGLNPGPDSAQPSLSL